MTSIARCLPLNEVQRTESKGGSAIAWGLFLLVNASLFMRPAEIVPSLEGLPIYEVLILACLAASLPGVLRQFRLSSLEVNPITLCVLGLLAAIVLSHLWQGDTWYARERGVEFLKVIIYYLLFVALVNSPERLRRFLICLAGFALVLCIIALLRYHHLIELTTIAPMEEVQHQVDPATGQQTVIDRLQATGIYGNPNDLARIVVVGITICLFGLAHKGSRLVRFLWVVPLGVFAYALQLTYSRGGLLALLAGIVVLFHARYGLRRKAVFAATLVLLIAIVLFGGRQTDIDTRSGTGQLRIQLWSDGLVAMRSAPVFGIGAGTYFKMAGNHAHNSFVEAYVETGFLGGTLFTSAFFLAAIVLFRLKPDRLQPVEPELRRMRPYVLSLIVGTIVGQFSSSREYSLPTYMILGLATVYLSLANQTPSSLVRLSPRLVARLFAVSMGTLLCFHLYAKFNAHF